MRIEDLTGIMDAGKQIICVCESEAESKIVDLLGKLGAKVEGELCLADGYGQFYILLRPKQILEDQPQNLSNKEPHKKPGEKPIDLETAWGDSKYSQTNNDNRGKSE